MSYDDPIGVIELGDNNLKCLIFKINENNKSEVLSSSITPSEGIHNNLVVNLKKASNAIRQSISMTEKKAKVSLKRINVIFEQPDFLCTNFSKKKKIDGAKINRQDIEFLLKEAKKQLTLNDKNQSIIHIFNYNYIVDGNSFVEEPIDVFADTLSHEITFITIPKNNLKNINQAFIDCDIEIDRLISNTFALGAKLLSNKNLHSGSAIINLANNKVSLGIFKNLALIHSITIPIGINHITNDISRVCSLSLKESEKIRNNFDYSFPENQDIFDQDDYLKKIFFSESKFRKISKNLLLNIIKARLDEIFDIQKKQLTIPGFNFNSGINLLLTGEGNCLKNLEIYVSNLLGINNYNNFENIVESSGYSDQSFNSCLGALKLIKDGWETEAIPKFKDKNIEKISFFKKIFG